MHIYIYILQKLRTKYASITKLVNTMCEIYELSPLPPICQNHEVTCENIDNVTTLCPIYEDYMRNLRLSPLPSICQNQEHTCKNDHNVTIRNIFWKWRRTSTTVLLHFENEDRISTCILLYFLSLDIKTAPLLVYHYILKMKKTCTTFWKWRCTSDTTLIYFEN